MPDVLVALTGPPRPNGYLLPVEATLRRDPNNEYDANAIRVEIGGNLVGHLEKEAAHRMAPILDALGCTECRIAGIIRGGYIDRPHVGVMLWATKRLSDAPTFRFGMTGAPRWPPSEDEGRA